MPENQKDAPLSAVRLKELRNRLLGGQPFLEMAHAFIEGAIESSGSKDPRFHEYYRAAVDAVAEENALEVAKLAQSPIEKTILHSLFLTFIKNDGLGLLVHRAYKDTPAEINEFREILTHWKDFFAWFQANRPARSMEEFLDSEVARGVLDLEERQSYISFIFRYSYIPMDSSYHMTLQPRFPNIKIEGKAIRPDIYFWIPSKPQVNVIVECDGFKYHSDKEHFKTDRQRDRALKALGYDVWRFSGSEIYTDPINAPFELAKYLWDRARAHDVH
jgi:REase_MTES_1575